MASRWLVLVHGCVGGDLDGWGCIDSVLEKEFLICSMFMIKDMISYDYFLF